MWRLRKVGDTKFGCKFSNEMILIAAGFQGKKKKKKIKRGRTKIIPTQTSFNRSCNVKALMSRQKKYL